MGVVAAAQGFDHEIKASYRQPYHLRIGHDSFDPSFAEAG
jgi:hypothetical protein